MELLVKGIEAKRTTTTINYMARVVMLVASLEALGCSSIEMVPSIVVVGTSFTVVLLVVT